MYKFRSMRKRSKDEAGTPWTSERDPRITRVGWVLRATALDELPQLINILKGDISFVGPRPEDPALAAQFSRDFPDFDLRHHVRPGLTGLAQVYGDYDSSPSEKLEYDMLYIKRQGFWLDLRLLLLSLWVTFRGRWGRRGKKT
jgi:lipopolysaccharide/colanic/teichoic acid biosynthesis glycosyltransferase